ncbi:hypothetical protein BDN72DRAFT_842165 [Pluteus cervinus]|uniref:Uncharacterized protein n=1 Tax=Pluteus cervinus TaxID=181527 RepID=A0ACD3AQC7_9AGAR|nr:hypothetical protein BDN72DRAFT_842165 [Pluteus cervinus]
MPFKFRFRSKKKARNDLLLQILEDFDDQALCRVSGVCQRLHRVSLYALFSRHCPDLLTAGCLKLKNHPPLLLPALHSALFISKDTPLSIHVQFDRAIPCFISELYLLSRLMKRTSRLSSINLDLQNLHYEYNYPALPVLRDEIVSFLELAVACGCKSLTVSQGQPLLEVFRRRWCPSKMPGRRTIEERPEEIERSPKEPIRVPVKLKQRKNSALQSLHLYGALLFEPAFLDHTLSFCNNLQITELWITSLTCRTDAWIDFFSRVTMPALKTFMLDANYTDNTFARFLRRHSETLESLSVILSGPRDNLSASIPFPSESNRYNFTFSKLHRLTGHMSFLERFLTSCLTTSERQHALACLPSLRSVLINVDLNSKNPILSYIRITETLNSIARIENFNHNRAELARNASVLRGLSPGRSDSGTDSEMRSWVRRLEINPVTPDIILPWLNVQLKKSWATLTFHSVEELYVNSSKDLGDGFFEVLPQFCSQFPNIKLLKFNSDSEGLKKRKTGDWEDLKGVCPHLKHVSVLGKFFLEMDDLINGHWLPAHDSAISIDIL